MTTKAGEKGWRLECDSVGSDGVAMSALRVESLSSDMPTSHYFAIRGKAAGVDRSHVARLLITCADWRRYEIVVLISRRGRIFEMAALSAPILKAEILIDLRGAPAGRLMLEVRPLSRYGYRARQMHRIVRVMRGPQRAHLKAVGMSWRQIATLDTLYKLASRFRANVFTHSYRDWFDEFYTLTASDTKRILRLIERWRHAPAFCIFVDGRGADKSDVKFTLDSIERQLYREYQVKVIDDALKEPQCQGSSDPRYSSQEDLWAMTITAGSALVEYGLFWFADAVMRAPQATVVYSDHDTIALNSELGAPHFKPDFSLELLRSQNYVGEAYCWRVDDKQKLIQSVESVGPYARLLELTREGSVDTVVHVPACLLHAGVAGVSDDDGLINDVIVSEHLQRCGIRATVTRGRANARRVRYHLPEAITRVSIIIPTRNGLAHLRPCVESVLGLSTYPDFEVIVVDNQSDDPDTLAYLDSLRHRARVSVLVFDEPFNYSRMNNFAVRHASGTWICLLNNDTEVISPDWIEDMGGYLLQGGVGVVGAKLLYSDGTVQHAGDAVGPGGCADHFHSGLDRDAPGYAGRAVVAQDLSAVTAACLLTKRDIFMKLNGLDEENLPVAFNDVDYCLRVREAGFRVVWTPHAILYHHESVSRGKDISPEQIRRAASEVAYMQKRWRAQLRHDPFYNPNLSYLRPDFSLSTTPRVRRPWMKSSG